MRVELEQRPGVSASWPWPLEACGDGGRGSRRGKCAGAGILDGCKLHDRWRTEGQMGSGIWENADRGCFTACAYGIWGHAGQCRSVTGWDRLMRVSVPLGVGAVAGGLVVQGRGPASAAFPHSDRSARRCDERVRLRCPVSCGNRRRDESPAHRRWREAADDKTASPGQRPQRSAEPQARSSEASGTGGLRGWRRLKITPWAAAGGNAKTGNSKTA